MASKPLNYYMGLPTGEYANSSKFRAVLGLFLEKYNDVTDLVDSLDAAFDLDLAIGTQLDMLGQIIGISRKVPFTPNYGRSPVLNDEDYRILLKATIGMNQWDGVQGSLCPLWQQIFASKGFGLNTGYVTDEVGGVIIDSITGLPVVDMGFVQAIIGIHDNHRMDMDVFIRFPNSSSIFIDLAEHGFIVPKPGGVKQKFYVNTPLPLFGFDYDDPYVSGFDKGHWYTPAYNRYPAFGFDQDNEYVSGFDRGNWHTNV